MSAATPCGPVTQMLRQWSRGDPAAGERLAPMVYEELRRLAQYYMRGERAGHTLQPTALINEAFLRLVDQGQPEWHSRSHFFRFSAHLMRQILVDYARSRNAARRGAGLQPIPLDGLSVAGPGLSVDLIDLDSTLRRLATFDERRSKVVELRYFGGMTEEETADALNLSVITVRRDMRFAEAWLAKELSGKSG